MNDPDLRGFRTGLSAGPDVSAAAAGESAGTMEPSVERVVWRRRGVRRPWIGTISAGDGEIRLSGRDPDTGVEVTLSIPVTEVESVRAADPGEELPVGAPCLVLELAGSEAILLSRDGPGPSRIAALARSLGAFMRASRLPVAQGG